MDADGDASNGISIPTGAAAAATSGVNFDLPVADFAALTSISNLVANSGSSTTSLISQSAAITHLSERLETPDPTSLIGSWVAGDGEDGQVVLTFIDSSHYVIMNDEDDADEDGQDGVEYGVIPTFGKHQVVNNRERESVLPIPTETSICDASSTRDPRVTHASKAEGKGREYGMEGVPPNPQGGGDAESDDPFPKGWKRMTVTNKKLAYVSHKTPVWIRVAAFVGRGPKARMSVYEAEAIEKIQPSDEELELLEHFYSADIPKDDDRRRTSVGTLTNNWTGELDKAREFARKNPLPEKTA